MKAPVAFTLGVIVSAILGFMAVLRWQSGERVQLQAEIEKLRKKSAAATKELEHEQVMLSAARMELQAARNTPSAPRESAKPATAPGDAPAGKPINTSIGNFLGDPVVPPANLDPMYSGAALTAAFRALVESRGLKVEQLGVDTSEFPFLVYGVVENGREFFRQIDAELKTVPGYAYAGSVTGSARKGSTYFSLNMMPNAQIPREQSEMVHRRLMIRLQMLGAAWQDLSP